MFCPAGLANTSGIRIDHRHVAHVLPLASGARQPGGGCLCGSRDVFVRRASLETRFPMEAIASLYKLTASELRVLQAIVEVGGVPAVAEALGISESTVKTHLHRVFAQDRPQAPGRSRQPRCPACQSVSR